MQLVLQVLLIKERKLAVILNWFVFHFIRAKLFRPATEV